MSTKKIHLAALVAIAITIPTTALVACSSDPDPVGPTNNPDAGKDVSVQPDATAQPDGGPDSAPNLCATGIVFDNKRVPGFPNVPQP